ncbi:MATE family efflux transporter [Rhizocola hellebori]|uniref:Probable multidrug resistance protein NorM n=1 Tax=Rhizocola hellebori TaxID=1392758 RepID=A0A8J3QFA3_9ACTN|nr:MATE family efflux transporter [Rhizocola hellebori]GIH08211.1 MATE family efflux transporter [Rhizocola hellebori]
MTEQTRAPSRQIAALGLPMLVGALSASLAGVVDTAMMGRFGAPELASVAASSAVFDIFSGIVLASVTGHQIMAARFAGREDPAGILRSLRTTAWFSGGIAVVLTFGCLFAGGWLTGLVAGGDPQLREIGADYLAARAPTLLLLAAFVMMTAIFNAYKKPKYGMWAGIVINALNILLDYLLIYGPGPFPRLGAAGNGLATTLSWAVGVGCLLVATRHFGLLQLLRTPASRIPIDFVTSIPKLGWPAIVSTGLDYLSVAIFFAIIGGLGAISLAGGRIAFEVMIFLFGVASAFAAAARILIGRAVGAQQVGEAKVFWRKGQLTLLVPAAILTAFIAVFPSLVARVFTGFPETVDAAADALLLVALALPLMAWTLGNVSVLRALGHTNLDMYANLAAALLIQLPVSWLLAEVGGLGLGGAFLGVLGYWLVRAAITELLSRRSMQALVPQNLERTDSQNGRLSHRDTADSGQGAGNRR